MACFYLSWISILQIRNTTTPVIVLPLVIVDCIPTVCTNLNAFLWASLIVSADLEVCSYITEYQLRTSTMCRHGKVSSIFNKTFIFAHNERLAFHNIHMDLIVLTLAIAMLLPISCFCNKAAPLSHFLLALTSCWLWHPSAKMHFALSRHNLSLNNSLSELIIWPLSSAW